VVGDEFCYFNQDRESNKWAFIISRTEDKYFVEAVFNTQLHNVTDEFKDLDGNQIINFLIF
jgi:hypothetical protein